MTACSRWAPSSATSATRSSGGSASRAWAATGCSPPPSGCSTSGCSAPGGEQYAPSDDDEDGTFGLATLRREHVSLKRGAVLFSYPAKGNIPRSVALRDPLLHRVVGSLLRRKGGGEELLAYKIKRDWCDVKTADLNGAVKELAGEEYTCKDLRTWNATVLAAVALAAGAAEKGVPGNERGASGSSPPR